MLFTMKKLSTINKIGQSALIHLYKPHSIYNAMEQSERSVCFPKEEYDLEVELKANHHSNNQMNINSNSGRSYQTWGIEIGRQFLKVYNGDNALDAIARLECLRSSETNSPSHLIVREWSSNDISGDHETYTVYRLSQKQEADVQRYVKDRISANGHIVVEPMPSYANHKEGHNFGSEINHCGWELNRSGATEEEATEDAIRRWCRRVK